MVKYSRTGVQFIATILQNINLAGFFSGRIYRGPAKFVCVPTLNCYSCPGAVGACPIGSLQIIANSDKFSLPFYALGLILIYGLLLGRFFCGWLCPFGFFQELLHRIPGRKLQVPVSARYIKYIILAVFVLIIPIFVYRVSGLGDPVFCEFICPAGTLEAGIPLLAANQALRGAMGWLFTWKVILLVLTIVLSVIYFRFFCRVLCPLGAIYAICNRFSLLKFALEPGCNDCGVCGKVCRMGLDPIRQAGTGECIHCLDCVRQCPQKVISYGFLSARQSKCF